MQKHYYICRHKPNYAINVVLDPSLRLKKLNKL